MKRKYEVVEVKTILRSTTLELTDKEIEEYCGYELHGDLGGLKEEAELMYVNLLGSREFNVVGVEIEEEREFVDFYMLEE